MADINKVNIDITKQDLMEAIDRLSRYMKMKHQKDLLLTNVGLLSTIRELIYVMFMKNITQEQFAGDEVYGDLYIDIQCIRMYTQVMWRDAYVTFKPSK